VIERGTAFNLGGFSLLTGGSTWLLSNTGGKMYTKPSPMRVGSEKESR